MSQLNFFTFSLGFDLISVGEEYIEMLCSSVRCILQHIFVLLILLKSQLDCIFTVFFFLQEDIYWF